MGLWVGACGWGAVGGGWWGRWGWLGVGGKCGWGQNEKGFNLSRFRLRVGRE